MTRFWITLEQGVRFVIDCLNRAKGGELFVPKIPSMKIVELAKVIAPESRHELVGIRPGEKLHEVMVTEDDARCTIELEDRYILLPPELSGRHDFWREDGKTCNDGFRYASNTNDRWLNKEAIEKMVSELELPEAKEWAKERGMA